jgi:type IV pilus assembly protein PilA
MKSNGFTLPELLGVIIILGLIALIAVPIINETIDKSKTRSYNAQVKTIEESGKKWGIEYTSLLPTGTDKCNIYLGTLINSGYLPDDKFIDPRDGSEMNGVIEISYNVTSKTYNYEYKQTASSGVLNCIR